MTTFDDPNREAVGLAPIWTGATEPPVEPPPEGEAEGFDPADYTVDEVKDYVDDHPGELGAILDAERAGKNRATLIGWLDPGNADG